MSNLIAIAPQFPHSWPDEAGQQKVPMLRYLIFAAALVAATATGAVAAPKLIYQVDGVTVSIDHGQMVVTATGAVNSGGWTQPHLQRKAVHPAESDTEEFEFVATPPPSDTAVIQALLPVSAIGRFPLPRYGAMQVKVDAESNSATAPLR